MRTELSFLCGDSISTAAAPDGTAVWRVSFASGANLGIECTWRVIADGRLIRAREDHRQLFGLPTPVDAAETLRQLAGRRILAVSCREDTADIIIDFGGGTFLEIISDSSGYEAWSLGHPKHGRYVAQGGGNVVRIEGA
jgi:hypothetical protein